MRAFTGLSLLLAAGCVAAPEPPGGLPPRAAPPAEAIAPAAGLSHLAWPQAADCRALAAAVAALPDEDRARLDPATAPIAVIASLPLVQDFPAAPAGVGQCRLDVRQVELAGSPRARPLAVTTVRSEYHKGERRATNARWTELKGAENELEEDEGAPGILRTGDPSLDLIGLFAGAVIGGVDRARKAWVKRDLDEELARTERYGGEAQWAPYTYELETVEAERGALLEVALEDTTRGTTARAVPLVRERRQFEVAKGRHRSDRALLEETATAVTENEVRAFEGQPPRPKASELLRAALTGRVDRVPAATRSQATAAGGRSRADTSAVSEEVGPDGVRRFRLR